MLLACNKGTSAAKPAADACAKYADKLCQDMGKETPTCASTKQALDLLPPAACAAGMLDLAYSKKKLGDARKKCDELASKLCADLGDTTETCTMVKTQTKSFPPERCGMMMDKYADVLADLKKMEAKNKPMSPETFAKAATGDNLPSFGPATAKVTIVEFSDFQCPFCSRAATATHDLKEKYGDKIRFVFRQFPLSFHDHAHQAAEAALAAHAQGKFWQMHDKLFADQKKLDRDSLEAAAKEIGLNVATFKKALDDKTYAATVDTEQKLGEAMAVDGTPTMFLNGKRVTNPTDTAAISAEIDKALAGG